MNDEGNGGRDEFSPAISRQVIWKSREVRTFAVELVRRALERGAAWPFTTDIVPDEVRGDGPGIAGSVVELLKNANVIAPVGITAGGKWYPERVKSARPGCKARYVCVHQLKSGPVAREFLRRNGEERMARAETFVEQELVGV